MPSSLEIDVETPSHQSPRHRSKNLHEESDYAAGPVEATWADELESRRRSARCFCSEAFREEMDPGGCGCIYLSALVCSKLGAGRVGNMAVLREEEVWVEVDDDDEATKKLVPTREIRIVVGPFWPMLLFVTYPLILVVSFCTFPHVRGKPLPLQVAWGALTMQLIRSLFNTGFRDPGILKRRKHPPVRRDGDSDDDEEDGPTRRTAFRRDESRMWQWSDVAKTYRPRNARYDPDCGVVIEGFDHTCPWTGTAIGKRNMGSFQCFVGLVFVCLIMDIFLLTGATTVG